MGSARHPYDSDNISHDIKKNRTTARSGPYGSADRVTVRVTVTVTVAVTVAVTVTQKTKQTKN